MTDYLRLMRISALPTLWANTFTAVWFGFAAYDGNDAGSVEVGILPILSIFLTSSFLYLAGMALNDFFDAKIDAVERPERVIPSGRIPRISAGIFGFSLLLGGLICAVASHRISGNAMVFYMAAILCGCILGYDAFLKRIPFLGPLVMGACRLFNICFVLAACGYLKNFAEIIPFCDGRIRWEFLYSWFLGIYVAGLTILSRFEANSPKIQRMVGFALSMLIPIDAVICLVFFGSIPALIVICLYLLAMGLRKLVAMS